MTIAGCILLIIVLSLLIYWGAYNLNKAYNDLDYIYSSLKFLFATLAFFLIIIFFVITQTRNSETEITQEKYELVYQKTTQEKSEEKSSRTLNFNLFFVALALTMNSIFLTATLLMFWSGE